MVYADTSFFVSVYISDRHSLEADKLLASGGRVCITALHRSEFAHAVTQQVFRKQLSLPESNRIFAELERDCAERVWDEVGMPLNAFSRCAGIARRHGPRLGIRTLDSLHVACALELKAESFWTFDERQAKLAKAEGLTIP